jgi:rod shape-determining protein MreD
MISQIPINIFRFILILLFEVLFLSNIHVHPLISPIVYPLFILLLPFQTPQWIMMILGFTLGMTIDFFLGTLGMHAAVLVLIAYIRPTLISLITPKGTEFELSPNIYFQGFGWFVIYLTISFFIAITSHFLIENGGLYNFGLLLLKIVISTTLSIFISILFLYIFSASKRRRHVK